MSALRLLEQEKIHYLLQINFHTNNIIINLTNLRNVWQIQITENEILQVFKVGNPLVQSSDKWISEYISNMITNNNTDIKINNQESDINITFSSNISSMSTKLNILLKLQSSELVYKEVTVPLLMIINELKFRQDKLLSLLKAKDVEIKEFKFEGANITRRNAVTEPFSSTSFDSDCLSTFLERSKGVLHDPCSAICPILSALYPHLTSAVASVNVVKEDTSTKSSTKDDQREAIVKEPVENKFKKETGLHLKRKLSETLITTKRSKKLYKI